MGRWLVLLFLLGCFIFGGEGGRSEGYRWGSLVQVSRKLGAGQVCYFSFFFLFFFFLFFFFFFSLLFLSLSLSLSLSFLSLSSSSKPKNK